MTKPHPSTLYGCLVALAETQPEVTAVVFSETRLSYAALLKSVETVARALLRAGVKKGDRVAMLASCRLEYWQTLLATGAIGGIWLGLGTRNRLDEYRYVVGDAEPNLLIGMAAFEGRDYREDLRALQAETPAIRKLVILGDACPAAETWTDFLAGAEAVAADGLAEAAAAVQPMDPTLIVYTSGTTGRPKGAVLSHYGLVEGNRAQEARRDKDSPRIVAICAFPINHIACAGDICTAVMVSGGAIILEERFDPISQLRTVARERCTIWGGIPTMVQLALNSPEFARADLSSVHAINWGGAPMPRDIVERLLDISPRLSTLYGLTETTVNVTWSYPSTDLDVLTSSIGKPGPQFPCRICKDDGGLCTDGEPGEIQFKGPFVMLEYWRRPEATKEAFTEDGWLRTGDIGFWRPDGAITLVGRRSEMFKSGGFNVYPREIELALELHPEVEYAAVVARPDRLYTEVGHAFVVRTTGSGLTAATLEADLRTRLANYKIPKTLEFLDEMPTLANAKVDKQALKARAAVSAGVDRWVAG